MGDSDCITALVEEATRPTDSRLDQPNKSVATYSILRVNVVKTFA